ncbi:unnamed protein product [Rotaria magnacalcarata]|uniref:Reverse transcriptase domain-containing protein n=1 Tax=Rotaria magnacalcarata TaxID=392030 RepID=A0A8S2P5X5_9BILA|nr:unnamed protein product [Rotaria magnacalcarata]
MITLLKHIYEKAQSVVRVEKETGEWFQTSVGSRQGDPLSPLLFITYLERVMDKAMQINRGINMSGTLVNNLRFADDIDALEEDCYSLHQQIEQLRVTAEEAGLLMNIKKPKTCSNTVLLRYLPQVEYLHVYIIDIIYSMKTNDEDLPTKFNYPKKLRVLHLSNFKIARSNCNCLNQLVDKFANTLEEFSLFLTHHCNVELDMCFGGYRLATVCSGLSHLRSLHFTFRTPFWLNEPLGCIRVCVNYHQVFRLVHMFSLPYVFSNSTVYRTTDLIDILFNTSEAEKDISNNLPIALRSLWSELNSWLRLLPNIKCLYVNSTELKHWFTNHRDNLNLNTVFRQIDRLYIDCSPIVNIDQNEEIMVPLLSFVIDKQRFRQLQCLRFILCKSISSAWRNIHKWIDFVFTHTNQHQLKCLRFDFIEKEQQEVPDMKTGDEIVSLTEPPCIADIHRFVSENHISYWIQYIYI